MKLNNFVGNEKTVERLSSLMESGHFPQSLIITGDDGIGKKTLARDLAATLVCRSANKPCGECSQCRKAMKKIHPDIFEYIPSGGERSFHIDTIRDEVINKLYMVPNESDYKIFILADAHCMTEQSQNALLKAIEEPPAYAIFIFTARSKSQLLSTILSRSVIVSLDSVDFEKGCEYICQNNSDVEYSKAKEALEISNGNIGKAIESMQDEKTSTLVGICRDICKALACGNEYSILTACSSLQKDKQGVIFVCDLLKNIFRDALIGGIDSEYISGQQDTALLLRERLNEKKLAALVNECSNLKNASLTNVNGNLLITQISSALMQAAGR